MTLESLPPEEQAAAFFLNDKGYSDLSPKEKERDGQYKWFLYYEVPGGHLDLMVEWKPELSNWHVEVYDFHE